MPEITSVEAIRAKLREFEERVDGAIVAAKTLARIKRDAEQLLTNAQGISAKCEQSHQEAEGVRLQLQALHREWEAQKQQVEKAQNEFKEVANLIRSNLDTATHTIGQELVKAEERLKAANKTSLEEQANLLRRLDASTQANADVCAKAQSTVTETARRLDGLLVGLRDDLLAEVRVKLTNAEELLESEAQRVEKYLEQEQKSLRESVERSAGKHESLLREEMTSFKEEMKRNLTEQQHAIDRQLTDFLNKQNALVHNLTQQIDSFNRVTQAQSSELTATNVRLNDLVSNLTAQKATVTTELATLAVEISELKRLLIEVEARLDSHGQAIASMDSSSQSNAAQLEQTIEKLKQLPLVGSKFR